MLDQETQKSVIGNAAFLLTAANALQKQYKLKSSNDTIFKLVEILMYCLNHQIVENANEHMGVLENMVQQLQDHNLNMEEPDWFLPKGQQ